MQCCACKIRKVGRAVECTGLENRQGRKILVSSNLTPSASQSLPLDDAELKARFLDCIASAVNLDAVALYERLHALDELNSVRDRYPNAM